MPVPALNSTGKNDSRGGNVEIGVGSGGWGNNVSASANKGKASKVNTWPVRKSGQLCQPSGYIPC